jgi:diguanylate cyclase (GGDEF)-like protein
MRRRTQVRVIIVTAVLIVAAAVWFGARAQRSASETGARTERIALERLTARLDIETGLRGYLLTGSERFLAPYRAGIAAYRQTTRELTDGAGLGASGAALVRTEDRLTEHWLNVAGGLIARRRSGNEASAAWLDRSKAGMDRFRAVNGELVDRADAHRSELEDRATLVVLGIMGLLAIVSIGVAWFAIERPARRAERRRAQDAEFAETLQFAADEQEARGLLVAELERSIPRSAAVVFARNNSENRLEAAAGMRPDSPLADRVVGAAPSACLAVRRGRRFERREGQERLLECELCGAVGANSLCLPSLVGGEVIGSVLVARERRPLDRLECRRVDTAVRAAAPVLANLRNLAIAETRAVTDALTGLANARAAAQDLERMVAFALRSETPLAAIMLDLDHFKRINDTFGHHIGDEVLAALGDVLRHSTRAGDFVARYGGEEFVILLQDTDTAAGVEMAERIREAIHRMHVPGLTGRVTASLGVASIPEHASDGDALLRAADRALYSAKNSGRNQVCVPADSDLSGLQEALTEPRRSEQTAPEPGAP